MYSRAATVGIIIIHYISIVIIYDGRKKLLIFKSPKLHPYDLDPKTY